MSTKETEAPREESQANDYTTRYCCICGATPTLRRVGCNGFCKKHLSDAVAVRAVKIARANKVGWKHNIASVADKSLANIWKRSRAQRKKGDAQ